MRKLTQVEPYRRALQAVGIETIVTGSGEFYARQEVFDVLNALEAALDPHDPIPLIAFLRSPMVGVADDVLWRLARGWRQQDGPLAPHLAEAVDAGDVEPDQADRVKHGAAVLDELRARADTTPPGALVSWLVDRTGYAAVLDAVPDSGQRRANLERLVALADRAPLEGGGLLADWAAALRRRVDNPPRDRDASPPEAGDRVLILSIHQAKGLEFPIVALADMGSTAQKGGGTGVEFSRELGIVAKWWEDPAAVPLYTLSYGLAAAARKEHERAEETRLLYVAATRARDLLLLTGGAQSSDGWWLPAVLEFAREQPLPFVEAGSLAAWAARHAAPAAAGVRPAGPGVSILAPLPAAPGETTARELAAAAAGDREPAELPAPARAAMRLRMRRGARAHAALERLPLRPAAGFDVRARLAADGVDAEDVESVAAFVEREGWPRLVAAREVHREYPFRLRLPAPAGVVVGTIDCLLQDADGEWWVWDYKLVTDESPEKRHQEQLAIYALAAAAALGLDRVRGALWYLQSGHAHEQSWDAAALADAEERLTLAFARTRDSVDEPERGEEG
jgi:ATP-dependent exoDNAse (exonuclease V) beta subunit